MHDLQGTIKAQAHLIYSLLQTTGNEAAMEWYLSPVEGDLTVSLVPFKGVPRLFVFRGIITNTLWLERMSGHVDRVDITGSDDQPWVLFRAKGPIDITTVYQRAQAWAILQWIDDCAGKYLNNVSRTIDYHSHLKLSTLRTAGYIDEHMNITPAGFEYLQEKEFMNMTRPLLGCFRGGG